MAAGQTDDEAQLHTASPQSLSSSVRNVSFLSFFFLFLSGNIMEDPLEG